MSHAPRALALAALLLACSPTASLDDGGLSGADLAALPDGAPPRPGDPLRGAVGYQIFVRSFADSDGDGSGDLRGITQRLDYLSALGVDLLWLTPIHPSPSYHGYDISDYESINPQLGDLAAFDELQREAHRRGVRVLLDLVLNHTSSQHPWFRAAAADPRSPEASRYLFRGDNPGWRSTLNPADPNPPLLFKALAGASPPRHYYSLFSSALPDLNLRDPRVPAYFQDVVKLWLRRGADGFRLDAARYLIESPDPVTAAAASPPAIADTSETHQALRALRAAVDSAAPQGAALLGEVWTDSDAIASYYGGGRELSAAFAFPLAGALIDAVKRGVAAPVRDALAGQQRTGVPAAYFVPFLSNHDQVRVATALDNDAARLRLCAALLLGLPGAPFLYYGEEVGLGQSQEAGDRAKRAPMPWSEALRQQGDAGSLWRRYQRLIRLRREVPALQDERAQVLGVQAGGVTPPGALALLRGGPGPTPQHRALLVYNLAGEALRGAQVPVSTEWVGQRPHDLLSGATLAAVTIDNRARYPLPDLPARGALWLVAP